MKVLPLPGSRSRWCYVPVRILSRGLGLGFLNLDGFYLPHVLALHLADFQVKLSYWHVAKVNASSRPHRSSKTKIQTWTRLTFPGCLSRGSTQQSLRTCCPNLWSVDHPPPYLPLAELVQPRRLKMFRSLQAESSLVSGCSEPPQPAHGVRGGEGEERRLAGVLESGLVQYIHEQSLSVVTV